MREMNSVVVAMACSMEAIDEQSVSGQCELAGGVMQWVKQCMHRTH